MIMEGWLNTDLEPDIQRGVVYLDISEQMPLPDESLYFIYSEHVIEHVSLETALAHFEDSYRVLKPGGVLRVAMPDLQFLLDFFSGRELTPLQRQFLNDTVAKFHPAVVTPTPTVLLNDFVRRWGHQFIYDRKLCSQLLTQAGFTRVDQCSLKVSAHVELSALEKHGTAITESYNELQTMVLEATK